MKKLIVPFFVVACSYAVNAQTFEGKIVYEISYPDLPGEMKQYESMMPKEMTLYVGSTFTRVEQPSAMGNTVFINDIKNKNSVMLMDMMGNKMGVKMNEEDIKKRDGNIEYTVKETDETKDIAGYKCKKATVSFIDNKDGEEKSFDVYYSPELEGPTNANWNNRALSNIKGFPLEYSMKQQNMLMRFTAKSVKKEKVGKSLAQIPSEYKLMSFEDFRKQMGGMMGAGAQ